MADTANAHPTDGRRRREKGPPSNLALPRLERVNDTECEHSEDSAGEKEAKRQRSNPGTPVSTPRRMPYDYDAVMGITRVGTREAEGFDEDLDSTEYHDANDTTEEPIRKEQTDADSQTPTSTGFQGGYGSSSLKECIELLNTTSRIAPAPLDSGIGDSAGPPHHIHQSGMRWEVHHLKWFHRQEPELPAIGDLMIAQIPFQLLELIHHLRLFKSLHRHRQSTQLGPVPGQSGFSCCQNCSTG